MKHCNCCGLDLQLSAFGKNKTRSDGLQDRCKDCRSVAHQKNISDPKKRAIHNQSGIDYYNNLNKEKKLKRYNRGYEVKMGVRPEERKAIFLAQGSVCALCKKSVNLDIEAMLDHDHACCPGIKMCGNCIRGVLCRRCNWGLGQFYDDPKVMRLAADYVESGGTDAVLAAAIVRIESDIEEYNNSHIALGHLKAALEALNERTRDREDRNVEGTHTI